MLLNDHWANFNAPTTWPSTSYYYGTIQVAHRLNHPGARQQASSWADAEGNGFVAFGDGIGVEDVRGLLR